jgi:hypothetical protein
MEPLLIIMIFGIKYWHVCSIVLKQSSSKKILKLFHILRPPLWSSGQSSWLQFQRSGFDSWRYQFFWEAVGLERGPLSIVSTIKQLLGRNSSGCGLESREYGYGDLLRRPHDTLYPEKLAVTLLTSGERTKAKEFSSYNGFYTVTTFTVIPVHCWASHYPMKTGFWSYCIQNVKGREQLEHNWRLLYV